MFISLVLASLVLATLASAALARDARQTTPPGTSLESPVVARVYYADRADLDRLANRLDVWDVKHTEGYLLALLSPAEYDQLVREGYRLEIDTLRTAELSLPHETLPGQGTDSIPGYPCYRTVEETYAAMQALAAAYPEMVTWIDIGNSWEKVQAGGQPGYDIYALRINNPAIPSPKPTFFLMAEIHAREYVTAETAARFAEYLLGNYGTDPDITWLLDYYTVYVVTMTNPDGRKKAEAGNLWRKNTDSDDGCTDQYSWGVDLNRNHGFHWGGADTYPCGETYQGPSAISEPETQAIQNYVINLFPDQRGPGDTDPAPVDTTGTFVTLHSYSQLVLWPWGWTGTDAPNHVQLQTLGRKMAYFNGYTPQQSNDLYGTTGTSDDWAYGTLGIASYTYEMGTDFFQGCASFESTIYPDNLQALMAAYKSARRPYMEPAGPDALDVLATPGGATPGTEVVLSANLDDTRFENNNGTEPTQDIAAAEYYIDTPPWITDPAPVAYPMTVVDGAFDENIEDVTATIDTTGLGLGRHTIFVRGLDADDNWGVVSAAFLYIVEPGVSPSIEGYVRDASNNQPLAATVKAGLFQASTEPSTGFYSMTVISGTYDLTAESVGFAPQTVVDVQAQNYQTVQQDFYLNPTCTVFTDDVEAGNQGWTAQSPWAITTEASHSPTHSWTDSPGGNYGNYRNISLTSQTFDLSGYTGMSLNFWHTYATETGWDYCYVEYYDGSAWVTAATYDGSHAWEQQTIPLPGLDGLANGRIRFRFTSDSYTVADGWHVDDITLAGGGAACTTPLAPTAEFTSSATTVNPGEPVQFLDLTYGTPPFTYLWDFGDGVGSSDEANPTYTYLTTGLFTVTLSVTNTQGSDSVSHPILVQEGECVPLEQVDLSLLNPGALQPGEIANYSAGFLPVFFTRPVTYTVNFDDGTTPLEGSTSDAPLLFDHTFEALGEYEVIIAAWNCSMTVPVTSTLLTSVITFTAGVEVSPLAQSGSGDPGTPVTYTFTVTNTGEQPDLVSVTLLDGIWPAGLPDPIGPLAAGGSATASVVVTVSLDAAAGAFDVSVLQFSSSHPAASPVTATVTTTANAVYGLEVSDIVFAQDGFPGTTVTYTIQVTNTGNMTDTFDVQLEDDVFDANGSLTIGPLGRGESVTYTVLVTIPELTPSGFMGTNTVTITSQGDPIRQLAPTLITTVRWNGMWIPIIMK
jgi:PKD repeat protein